jgi:hypothetical protein
LKEFKYKAFAKGAGKGEKDVQSIKAAIKAAEGESYVPKRQ